MNDNLNVKTVSKKKTKHVCSEPSQVAANYLSGLRSQLLVSGSHGEFHGEFETLSKDKNSGCGEAVQHSWCKGRSCHAGDDADSNSSGTIEARLFEILRRLPSKVRRSLLARHFSEAQRLA
eukprot:TRINITY_DN14642_c0_g1_i1.p1 TRINITY_DN14642_c0_g1~~TRINITY_DN14642_c0_g1_i1.p1  ORF type:complete len:121 (-),score=22.85 TRINITY_DN14642_c0_g1_i1:25-387(-)